MDDALLLPFSLVPIYGIIYFWRPNLAGAIFNGLLGTSFFSVWSLLKGIVPTWQSTGLAATISTVAAASLLLVARWAHHRSTTVRQFALRFVLLGVPTFLTSMLLLALLLPGS